MTFAMFSLETSPKFYKTAVATAGALSDTPNLSLNKAVFVNLDRICLGEEGNNNPKSLSVTGSEEFLCLPIVSSLIALLHVLGMLGSNVVSAS